jgi:hypothetical protein
MRWNKKRALDFAREAHKGQKRRFTSEDYISHPIAVARMAEDLMGNDEAFIVGVLHDVVEYTEYTYNDIKHLFGSSIASDVATLTRTKRPNYKDKLMCGSTLAKVVKCCDIKHNVSGITQDIIESNPEWVIKYCRKKAEELSVLWLYESDLMKAKQIVEDCVASKYESALDFVESDQYRPDF